MARCVDRVLNVDDAPVPLQPIAVRPTVAGTAAVIDIGHREAAAGPVLHMQIEGRSRGRRRTAMTDHDERWTLPSRRHEILVPRRVVERVRRAPTTRRELNRLGKRDVTGTKRESRRGAKHLDLLARERQPHDGVRCRCRRTDKDRALSVGHEAIEWRDVERKVGEQTGRHVNGRE